MNEQPLMKIGEESISKLALAGDVSVLNQPEKIQYYKALCERVGLDAATQPFKLLNLQGKQVFYCDRGGCQQLSRLHNVSHSVIAREVINDCYVVTAKAFTASRSTESVGAVNIKGLAGDALCNAYMKAETKAKRRATLDLLGLGMLDETEVGTIPNAQPMELTGHAPIPIAQEARFEDLPPQPPKTTAPARYTMPAAQEQPTWKSVIVPKFIKKYAGSTLGEMPEKDLRWWAENYEPKPYKGAISQADSDFRAALDLALNDLNDRSDNDEIPM